MTEQLREIAIRCTIDTNKASFVGNFAGTAEFIEWWNAYADVHGSPIEGRMTPPPPAPLSETWTEQDERILVELSKDDRSTTGQAACRAVCEAVSPNILRRLWKADSRCFWCRQTTTKYWLARGQSSPPDEATVDHIYPRPDPRRNSSHVLACRRCNGQRGDLTCEQFRVVIADAYYAAAERKP